MLCLANHRQTVFQDPLVTDSKGLANSNYLFAVSEFHFGQTVAMPVTHNPNHRNARSHAGSAKRNIPRGNIPRGTYHEERTTRNVPRGTYQGEQTKTNISSGIMATPDNAAPLSQLPKDGSRANPKAESYHSKPPVVLVARMMPYSAPTTVFCALGRLPPNFSRPSTCLPSHTTMPQCANFNSENSRVRRLQAPWH